MLRISCVSSAVGARSLDGVASFMPVFGSFLREVSSP